MSGQSKSRPLVVADIGRMPYREAWDLQKRVHARLVHAHRNRETAPPPHVLIIVEHPPVYTLGKSGDPRNMLVSESLLAARGAELVSIDRGGDMTFHGPGQLVAYPILDLNRVFTDIHRYMRGLEETVIRTCADDDVQAERVDGRTGVWVGPDDRGLERKICAMGIRTSRWITMHGFAFNIETDLSWFDLMVPCGIRDRGVTSLSAELGREVDAREVRDRTVAHFADVFEMAVVERHDRADAASFLEHYAAIETA